MLAAAAPAVASQAGIGSDRSFAKDNEVIQAQQATGGKVDLNSAPVVSATIRCEPYTKVSTCDLTFLYALSYANRATTCSSPECTRRRQEKLRATDLTSR
jgi:hypothetical protein